MRKEARKQLNSLIIYLVLKRGTNWRSYITELAPFWDGPLDEDSIFMCENLLWSYRTKKVVEILSSMKSFEMHPIYTRDFIQGVIDSTARSWENGSSPNFEIGNRPELKEFFESGECGFSFKLTKHGKRNAYRSSNIPFLHLPCKGELDKYLAGVLTGSVPYKDENGEIFCRVKKKCIPNLKRFGIIFKECDEFILISAFYLMLFCGDIPETIYSKWIDILDGNPSVKMKSACVDSLMHWRHLFGRKEFKTGMLPYLMSQNFYQTKISIGLKDVNGLMEEKRFDFIDEKIVKRCKRWYNIHAQKNLDADA